MPCPKITVCAKNETFANAYPLLSFHLLSHEPAITISGCDVPSSYGYELALRLDHQGYTVFAGCADCNSIGARSLASRGTTNLAILQIDVTKQEEIDDAAEMIQDMIEDDGRNCVFLTHSNGLLNAFKNTKTA